MPVRTLKVPAPVKDLVRSLHPVLKRKIRAALDDILKDSNCGKLLQDELQGLWSLLVGRHRVIYLLDASGAEIVAIGPRRAIYEETERKLRSKPNR